MARRFEMFTDAGDDAVEEMVNGIVADIRAGNLARRDLETAIAQGCQKVAKIRRPAGDTTSWGDIMTGYFDEVYDTEPQGGIAEAISVECEAQGWKPVSRWDW